MKREKIIKNSLLQHLERQSTNGSNVVVKKLFFSLHLIYKLHFILFFICQVTLA